MRYFVPDIRVPSEAPEARERLGGVPVGLTPALWPKCRECGGSQSLLAQLEHHTDRLDLGRAGRTLFVFQCNHDPGMCDTWQSFSGANSCFVLEPEDLVGSTPSIPDDDPPLDPEVRIASWIERDDGLSGSLAPDFISDDKHLGLPEEVHNSITWSTRLGGYPKWMQSAEEAPQSPWRFAAQLDQSYSFLSPPTDQHAWILADEEKFEGRTHLAEGPNFGFGLGYIFLCETPGVPNGCFFWQR